MKKKQTEILKVKYLMNEIENTIESTCDRVDQMEDRMRNLKIRKSKITQLQKNRQKKNE